MQFTSRQGKPGIAIRAVLLSHFPGFGLLSFGGLFTHTVIHHTARCKKVSMKVKYIPAVLLIAFLLTSCAPAVITVSPTKTAAPLPTVSPIPPTAILLPTPVSKTAVPTGEPIVSLTGEGPWLVYRHNAPSPGYGDMEADAEEFVLLNQDGSGRTLITLPECEDQINAFLMQGDNSSNSLLDIGGDLYIFQPSQAAGMLVYRQSWYSACHTFFSGDGKDGLLATFYQPTKDVSPELILYELPGGKIRERFPLVRCPEGITLCEEFRSNWGEMMRQQPHWSPNGRYLAFVAIMDAASSDLFVYDAQNGNLRRLTDGPDWVGPIEWSPDGTQIIMKELLNDNEFFFDPYSKPPSSVWSVSVSTSKIKFLYSTGEAFAEQNILDWLDDQRFVAYEGFLVNADQARNLRLVDIEAGTSRILFEGTFVMASFDPVHEVFALFEINTETYPEGIRLVSLRDGTVHRVDDYPYYLSFPWWDEESGLFVSDSDCENDPQSLQALNYQGALRCVTKPVAAPTEIETASYPAPNGKWSVSAKDGLWLEAGGQPAVPVSQETASDVIWCPDSSCFFFSVLQQNQTWTLYRVSLPDLVVRMVDEEMGYGDAYQWLGSEQ